MQCRMLKALACTVGNSACTGTGSSDLEGASIYLLLGKIVAADPCSRPHTPVKAHSLTSTPILTDLLCRTGPHPQSTPTVHTHSPHPQSRTHTHRHEPHRARLYSRSMLTPPHSHDPSPQTHHKCAHTHSHAPSSQISQSEAAPHFTLLQLFAYGTWPQYKGGPRGTRAEEGGEKGGYPGAEEHRMKRMNSMHQDADKLVHGFHRADFPASRCLLDNIFHGGLVRDPHCCHARCESVHAPSGVRCAPLFCATLLHLFLRMSRPVLRDVTLV